MKKRTAWLIAAILLAVSLAACGAADSRLTAVLIGGADGADALSAGSPIDCWSEKKTTFHADENAPETLTVSFLGKDYTGSYRDSVTLEFDTYQSDYYSIEGGWFSVRSDTGALVEILLPVGNESGSLAAEECLPAAQSVLEQYTDAKNYQLEKTRSDEFLHAFTFTRYLGGAKTRDSMTVAVSAVNKEVVTFSTTMLGEFARADPVAAELCAERLHSREATEAMEETLSAVYDENMFTYQINDSCIIKLPDGALAMGYSVDTDVVTVLENGKAGHTGDLLYIVVYEDT